MSFNIRYDNVLDIENRWKDRKGKIVQLIDYYNPSIFGIQEGLVHQVNFIDSSLATYSYYGIGRKDGKTKGEYCAIFYDTTKFDLIKYSTFWLSETPDSVSIGWDAALERICTYGLFEDQNTKEKIWVFNTHFDHMGYQARNESAKLILKIIRQVNGKHLPIVIMGDLNTIPEEKPIQIFKTQLNDALEISEKPLVGPAGTFNGFNEEIIEKRIDYFFTDNLIILSLEHIDDRLNNNKYISDHLPVLITFKILPSTKN